MDFKVHDTFSGKAPQRWNEAQRKYYTTGFSMLREAPHHIEPRNDCRGAVELLRERDQIEHNSKYEAQFERLRGFAAEDAGLTYNRSGRWQSNPSHHHHSVSRGYQIPPGAHVEAPADVAPRELDQKFFRVLQSTYRCKYTFGPPGSGI